MVRDLSYTKLSSFWRYQHVDLFRLKVHRGNSPTRRRVWQADNNP